MAISNDVLFDIFSWLPAKSIYKFRAASKLFSNFSRETYFAMRQSQNAMLKDDSCFFIQRDISQRYIGQTELHPLPGEELSYSGVSNNVVKFMANSTKILSSRNGLVLCRRVTGCDKAELFITNPATQSWVPIPLPHHVQKNNVDADLKIVFECDGSDSNCMVFLFYNDKNNNSVVVDDNWFSHLDCKVYVEKEGVWKAREGGFFTGGRDLRFDMPVFHNGAVHFISDCFPYYNKNSPYFRPYIMSYNFEDGTSKMLRVPKEARRGSHDKSCDMRIFKWGKVTSTSSSSKQSICLVRLRKSVFTVWVLSEYESCLWKKIVKIRVKAMGLMEEQEAAVVTGFTVLNGDLLVFATEKKVYGYGLTNGEKCVRAEEICEHGCESKFCLITSYSNTLRTCGADATPLLLHPNSVKEQQPYHDSFSWEKSYF